MHGDAYCYERIEISAMCDNNGLVLLVARPNIDSESELNINKTRTNIHISDPI